MTKIQSKVAPEILQIVSKFSRALKERAVPIKNVILFGSQARGTAVEESDIDVLVIVKKLDKRIRAAIIDEAFNLSLQENVQLIAVPCDIEEFNSPLFQVDSFFRNVYNDGVIVT
jgi:predicted nucleotidyltransferase